MEKTVDPLQDSSKDSGLEQLFLDELNELYGAEQHQLTVLLMLKKAASSQKLQNVLASHLDDTREHIGRLEKIFGKIGIAPAGRLSEAMMGITREGERVIETTGKDTATRDAGIIVSVQKLEHYEITAYGSVAQHARTLDHEDLEDLLELTLHEEKEADDLLTALAENYINSEAKKE